MVEQSTSPYVDRVRDRNNIIYEINIEPISSDFIQTSLDVLMEFDSSEPITKSENVLRIVNEIASLNSIKLTTIQPKDFRNFVDLLRTAERVSSTFNPELTSRIKRIQFDFLTLYAESLYYITFKSEYIQFKPKFLLCETKLDNFSIYIFGSYIDSILNNKEYTSYFLSYDKAKRHEYISDLKSILNYLNSDTAFKTKSQEEIKYLDDWKQKYLKAIEYFSQLIDNPEVPFYGENRRMFNPQSISEHPSLGMITFNVTYVSPFEEENNSTDGYTIVDETQKMRISFKSCGWDVFFELIDENTYQAELHFQPFGIQGPPPQSRMSKNFVMAHYIRGLQNFEYFVRFNPTLFAGKKIVGGNSMTNPSFMKVASRLGFTNIGSEYHPVMTHPNIYEMFEKLNQFPINKITDYTKEVTADTIFRARFKYDGIDEESILGIVENFDTEEAENAVRVNMIFDLLISNPALKLSAQESNFIYSNPKCSEYNNLLEFIIIFLDTRDKFGFTTLEEESINNIFSHTNFEANDITKIIRFVNPRLHSNIALKMIRRFNKNLNKEFFNGFKYLGNEVAEELIQSGNYNLLRDIRFKFQDLDSILDMLARFN